MRSQPHLERLTIQAAAWRRATARVLDRIGIDRSWRCVELGCGPIGALDLLARRAGRVIGIDRDPAALLAAMDGAAGRLPNVELRAADAVRTGLPSAGFDLVHARLLAQETGAGPLIAEGRRLLRPGGILLLEEPGPEPWEIDPAPPGYRALAPRVIGRFLARKGGAGPALPGALRRAGLVKVDSSIVRLDLRGGDGYAAMPRFALAVTGPELVATGRATRPILRRLLRDLAQAATDPGVRHRSFPLWQVWGRRRGGPGWTN